jgi:hypothetical protein
MNENCSERTLVPKVKVVGNFSERTLVPKLKVF